MASGLLTGACLAALGVAVGRWSAPGRADTPSRARNFAGYQFGLDQTIAGITTTIVLPKLKCGKANEAIEPGSALSATTATLGARWDRRYSTARSILAERPPPETLKSVAAASVGSMSKASSNEVTWQAFVTALKLYKQRFAGKSGQDLAYVQCLQALEGRSITDRAARANEIVTFLNRWAARVSRTATPVMLSTWIGEQTDRLERLAGLTIADDRLAGCLEEVHALYGSLMTAGRAVVRNWSDAANSKALHQIVPAVFVMWDKRIKRFALDYADFTQQMHRLACRLIQDSPYRADLIEIQLQAALGYAARKPLAKYLDEFNVVALDQLRPTAPGPPVS